ncbi:hypothetical protein N7532_004396 [Penicillium argentinense]|uniref:Uncharacterized protein n=1 Tax=Penicillium argentinense TaxID=1131581 RepID=A0A9W9FPV8_9EURO|nr:uncharacterized protein N7532_004396 [Penicillium argentinense]KAJ5103867.1 hypothetical protein N7532_004396 [Penicillium argentinense]
METDNPQPPHSKPRPPIPATSDPRSRPRPTPPRPALNIHPSLPRRPCLPSSPAKTTTPVSAAERTLQVQPIGAIPIQSPRGGAQGMAYKIHGMQIDLSGIMPQLKELMDVHAARAFKCAELAQIHKEDAFNQRTLTHALRSEAFPATIDSLQAISDAHRSEISRRTEEVKVQELRSAELTDRIQRLLSQTVILPESQPPARVETAAGSSRELAELREQVNLLKESMVRKDDLPTNLTALEKTVDSQSRGQTTMRGNIKKLEEWKASIDRELKQLKETESTKVVVPAPKPTPQDPWSTKGDIVALEQKLNRKIQGYGETSKEVSALSERFLSIEKKLEVLRHEQGPGLQDRVSTLEERSKEIQVNWKDLERSLPALTESAAKVENYNQTSDTLITAVRSLETRYNNLNTDELVQHMARVMQEMYPTAKQLHERMQSVEFCQRATDEKLESLMRKLGTSMETTTRIFNQLKAQNADQHHFLQAMKKDLADHLDRLSRLEGQGQDQDVGTRVQIMEESLNGLRRQPQMEEPSRQESLHREDKEMHEKMCTLKDEMESLRNQLVKAATEVNSLFETQISQSKALTGCESSTATNQGVSRELAPSNSTSESQVPDISAPGLSNGCSDPGNPSSHIPHVPSLKSTPRAQRSANGIRNPNGRRISASPTKNMASMSVEIIGSSAETPAASPRPFPGPSSKKRRWDVRDSDDVTYSSPAGTPIPSLATSSASDVSGQKRKKKNLPSTLGRN